MRGLKAKGGRSIEAGKYRKDNELKDVACLPEVIEEHDSNNKIQRT